MKYLDAIQAKQVDGIIFDVDGTIWDSTDVVAEAWMAALDAEGLTGYHFTGEMLKGLFGLLMPDIMDRVLPNETEEMKSKMAAKFYEQEHIYLLKKSGKVYAGMEEMLRKLSERYPLFIVSNCQGGYIEVLLQVTGFGPYITDHVCPGDTNLNKAENIKLIAKKYGLSHPIYVGDTLLDESSTREAGALFAHAAYGFGEAKAPDMVIDQPLDLVTQFCSDR